MPTADASGELEFFDLTEMHHLADGRPVPILDRHDCGRVKGRRSDEVNAMVRGICDRMHEGRSPAGGRP